MWVQVKVCEYSVHVIVSAFRNDVLTLEDEGLSGSTLAQIKDWPGAPTNKDSKTCFFLYFGNTLLVNSGFQHQFLIQ